jgi:hypothetical protein
LFLEGPQASQASAVNRLDESGAFAQFVNDGDKDFRYARLSASFILSKIDGAFKWLPRKR